MKAVYKKRLIDKIHELKIESLKTRKEIEYFLVTPEEWNEIRSDWEFWQISSPKYGVNMHSFDFDQLNFKCVQLKHNSNNNFDQRTFIIQDTQIFGIDVVVAPKEYH
jgi:hypothetical protein